MMYSIISFQVDVSSMEIMFRIFQRCMGACLEDMLLVTPDYYIFHRVCVHYQIVARFLNMIYLSWNISSSVSSDYQLIFQN